MGHGTAKGQETRDRQETRDPDKEWKTGGRLGTRADEEHRIWDRHGTRDMGQQEADTGHPEQAKEKNMSHRTRDTGETQEKYMMGHGKAKGHGTEEGVTQDINHGTRDTGHGLRDMEYGTWDTGHVIVKGRTRDSQGTVKGKATAKRDKLQRNNMGHGTRDRHKRQTRDMGHGTWDS